MAQRAAVPADAIGRRDHGRDVGKPLGERRDLAPLLHLGQLRRLLVAGHGHIRGDDEDLLREFRREAGVSRRRCRCFFGTRGPEADGYGEECSNQEHSALS